MLSTLVLAAAVTLSSASAAVPLPTVQPTGEPAPTALVLPEWGGAVNGASRAGFVLARSGSYQLGASALTAGLGVVLLMSDGDSGGFELGTGFFLGLYGLAAGGFGAAVATPPLVLGTFLTAQGLRRDGVSVGNAPGWLALGLLGTGAAVELYAIADPNVGYQLHPVGVSLVGGSLISAAVQGALNTRATHHRRSNDR